MIVVGHAALAEQRDDRDCTVGKLEGLYGKLRLLRAHGLIQKIQKSYRYKVTVKGRPILTALMAACNATADTLFPKAA